MAVYTQVSAEALSAYLQRYDVGELLSAKGIAEGVENSNYLVDTTQGRFVLTLYEKRVSADDLPFFLALLDHLDSKGLAVPPAIKDRTGQAIQLLEGRPACLIRFLPGVSLSHPTPEQAWSAAASMGRMHAALMDFVPRRLNTMGSDSWRPLFERCGPSLDEIAPTLRGDLAAALDEVLHCWPRDGEYSVIHADLFPDNVLMRGNVVTGLIDFYFACSDLRLYDLAIMHSAWCFDMRGEAYDAAVGTALLEGYADTFGLSDVDRAQLSVLAKGACIRFALSRAWDWLNTPADALVTRKDPLAYTRRLSFYQEHGTALFA